MSDHTLHPRAQALRPYTLHPTPEKTDLATDEWAILRL